ncbi:hypothetical protein ACVGVM_10910 [Pseudonocardia bannensis]|uniref:Uncharacterized protein n=1 Tax=Pseudonocardia bannensis TaxID=630973 RepID=A0A848DNN6_9PSEU|nr:hypothetical protein [Pseudonocardia bannensis]NMH94155.1 hypothetical protein [Pseudonocardia bannensis]
MHIDWSSLLVVAVVSAAVALTVVVLVAFAIVGLSGRAPHPGGDGEHTSSTAPAVSPAVGTTVALLCLLACVLIVGYGLYVLVV